MRQQVGPAVAVLVLVVAVAAGVVLVRGQDDGPARDQGVVVAEVQAECQVLEARSDDLWVSGKGYDRASRILPAWRGRRIEARLVLTGDLGETWIAGHLTAADGSRVAVVAARLDDDSAGVTDDCPAWPEDR